MATQTRRTTRRSATFFRATVKASMVTACCGLVLLSAVVASCRDAPEWTPSEWGAYKRAPLQWDPPERDASQWDALPRAAPEWDASQWDTLQWDPQGIPINGLPIQWASSAMVVAVNEGCPRRTAGELTLEHLEPPGLGKSRRSQAQRTAAPGRRGLGACPRVLPPSQDIHHGATLPCARKGYPMRSSIARLLATCWAVVVLRTGVLVRCSRSRACPSWAIMTPRRGGTSGRAYGRRSPSPPHRPQTTRLSGSRPSLHGGQAQATHLPCAVCLAGRCRPVRGHRGRAVHVPRVNRAGAPLAHGGDDAK